MSDVESDIEEDIAEYSNDGEDFEYDVDESDIMAAQPIKRKTTETFPSSSSSSAAAAAFKTVPKSMVPAAAVSAAVDDEYNDDYSQGFDDEYSNTFEDVVDGGVGNVSQKMNKEGNRITDSHAPTAIQLPSVAMIPLQAEIALEQISKEVVRLRNQQRNLLHERRQVAREKKERAESRRAQYQLELRDLKAKIVQKETECIDYQEKMESLQRAYNSAMSSKDIVVSDMEMKENEIMEFKAKMIRMQTEMEQHQMDFKTAKHEWDQREEEWQQKHHALQLELTRSEMLASVVQQSLETNEARLAKERERLPEEHRKLLDEQAARNKALEGALLEREGILRAEEARRSAVLDQRAKDIAEDMARQRLRVENDLSAERASLHDLKQQLDHERQRLEAQFSKERALLTASSMDLTRREMALAEGQRAIDRAYGELDAAKIAIEPILRATNSDRDATRRCLENAEGILREAEERASSVLEAEKGLQQMERDLASRESATEEIRMKYTTGRKLLQAEAAKLLNTQKSMDAERFRLHSAALELASQAMEIRKFAGTMTSNKYGSTNVAVGSSSRLMNHGGIEENKFKEGVHDGDRNVRNVNKENSLSFPPPMLGSMHQLDHIASTVQAMAESLTQPLKSSGNASQEERHNVHWMSDTIQSSTYKPPFRSSRGPSSARHYQEFDDQDSQDTFDPPMFNRRQTSSSSSIVQPQRASMSDVGHGSSSSDHVKDELRNITMALSNARSSWPLSSSSNGPNAISAMTTLATQQAQDEEDALSGATLRISIDSAQESAKSLKDMAAKYGMFSR